MPIWMTQIAIKRKILDVWLSIHIQRAGGLKQGLLLGCCVGLTACASEAPSVVSAPLNSPYTDEQPALSGNGRYVALVTNRGGTRKLVLYDLRAKRFLELPSLNRNDAIAESPSLSYTGRYIVYLASDRGRPEIELYDRIDRRIQVLSGGYRGWVRNPNISPDGRYVVFETGRHGQWDVEVIDRGPYVELDRPDGS